jgi:hypothetical protein
MIKVYNRKSIQDKHVCINRKMMLSILETQVLTGNI